MPSGLDHVAGVLAWTLELMIKQGLPHLVPHTFRFQFRRTMIRTSF